MGSIPTVKRYVPQRYKRIATKHTDNQTSAVKRGRDEGSKDHEMKRNNHPEIQNISQIKSIDTGSEKIVRSHKKKILQRH